MTQTSDTRYYDLSERDDWKTPPDLLADLQTAVGGFDLDPCAGADTSIGATNFRLEDGQDGLEREWDGVVFVNPPFSYKSEWLAKTVAEIQAARADTVVVLTPDGTDTISWWHQHIASHAELICFCEGRISYYADGEQMGSPTFGTAISVFGTVPDGLADVLQEWGHVVRTV